MTNKQYEYKIVRGIMGSVIDELNLLGLQGWELCCVRYDSVFVYYFKREIDNVTK